MGKCRKQHIKDNNKKKKSVVWSFISMNYHTNRDKRKIAPTKEHAYRIKNERKRQKIRQFFKEYNRIQNRMCETRSKTTEKTVRRIWFTYEMHLYSYTPHIFRWTWGTHQKNGLWEISHNCKSLPISCEKKHTEIAHQELLSFSRQISSFGRNVQQFHYFVRVFSPHTNTHFSNSTNNNTTNCKHLILTDHMWYLNAWTETHNT